ncbi:hypothetical protein ENTCAN_06887 [Enterobacter cancerogenus ATCC 35316]|nr:hypothetical protein ENTCAN_06887 [Enterobacter cancerogenus ATCC 35316]
MAQSIICLPFCYMANRAGFIPNLTHEAVVFIQAEQGVSRVC